MRTLISYTVTVSVYKTASEPIQQNAAVHYHTRLRWIAMNLLLQQTVTNFYPSDVGRPFRSQVQFVCCGCFLRAFSWVCCRRLRKRRIWYLSGWGRLILSYWQNDKKNPTNASVVLLFKQSITQAVYPILFICPVICNFKYQGIYRWRSLSR